MIFDKNSILDIVAGIDRHDDIWPEMDSLGVLEGFCTKNRYPNAFRSNFKPFSKNQFFVIFTCGTPQYRPHRIFCGCRNFYMTLEIGLVTSKLFPIQKGGYLVEFLAITTLL